MAPEEIELKGGFTTKDPRLDRLPQFDEKSRAYPIRTFPIEGVEIGNKFPRSFTWSNGYWLDQGREGRCVEYSICHDLLARPKPVPPRLVQQILDSKLIYWPAQREDEWEGGSYPGATPRYEGTSVLAGMKVAAKLGLYKEYRWAFTLEDALLGLGYGGPLMLGINWHRQMGTPNAEGWIKAEGPVDGGHAIMANAVRLFWKEGVTIAQRRSSGWLAHLDLDLSYITLWNSWGSDWGNKGTAKLSVRHFDALRKAQGEVCIATQRAIPASLAA